MNDQLVHIFDDSTCLTKRQLKDYVTGIMGDEECHAAEVHLNSCPFCSDAVDGMMMHKDEAAQLLADLNPDFLKEHFAQQLPQVHLNAIAVPVDQPLHGKKKKNNVRPLWRTASVAAAVLFCTGVVWYYSYQKDAYRNNQVARDMPSVVHTPSADNKMIAQTAPQQTPDENNHRNAGTSQPVAPLPVVPEQRESKGNAPVTDEVTAIAVEKPAAAPPAAVGKFAADSVQAGKVDAQNFNLYNNNVQSNNYAASPNDVRPYYGNSYTNRNQSFNRGLEYNNTRALGYATKQQTPDKSTTGPGLHIKPAAASKPVVKDTETETAPAATGERVTTAAVKDAYMAADVDEARHGGKETVALKKKAMLAPAENADDLYYKGDYKAALAAYNKDVSHPNKGRRHYAVLGAARCYLNMGQKVKARQLLQSLVDEGGAQSRTAKKMLRKLDGDTQ